jgi:hypothetical protein
VRQWRYDPGRQGRMPVAVFVTVSMEFTID